VEFSLALPNVILGPAMTNERDRERKKRSKRGIPK